MRLITESSAWTSLGRRREIADLFVMFIACMSQRTSKIHKTFVLKLAIVLISNIQSPHEANLLSCEAIAQNHNIKIPDYGTGTIDLRKLLF